MGTISEKLTYLNDTKGLLKDSINSLGGEITSQTTFRNYATELDSIYSRLPKVSDTGSNISLSPTLKGRLGSVLKGNTLQDGTPTPDSPVEIQSATGRQVIKVEGKNLLPFTNQDFTYNSVRYYVQNGSLYLNGTSTGETNTTSINYKNNFGFYLDAGTYIISMKTRSVRLPLYVMKYSDDTELTVINGYNLNNKTFTLTERTQIYFGFYIYNQVFNQDDIEVQLEKGSTATTYEEYQSQEYEINLGNIHLYENDQIIGTPDNWSIKSTMGEVILNGSETWGADGSLTNTIRLRIATSYFPNTIGQSYTQHTRSDYFVFSVNYNNDTPHYYIGGINANSYFFMPKTLVSNVTDFKTWLSNNNVKVIYLLDEPTTTPITNTELISQLNALYYAKSYNGTTNITITSENLELIMTASAIKGEE